jgi:hypothetical protein
MLLISSIMFTVLPTPAPPNRPTLPPLANGQIRSITLMPVGSRSTEGDSSSNFGAFGGSDAARRRDRAGFVDRATQHVHDAAQRAGADRHRNRCAGGLDRHAAAQAVGGTQRDGAHDAVAELLLHFEGQTGFGVAGIGLVEGQGFKYLGHGLAGELDVHHRADALNDVSVAHGRFLKLNPLSAALDQPASRRRRRSRKFPW